MPLKKSHDVVAQCGYLTGYSAVKLKTVEQKVVKEVLVDIKNGHVKYKETRYAKYAEQYQSQVKSKDRGPAKHKVCGSKDIKKIKG